MSDTLCPHGSKLLMPGSPWPDGGWVPYCRTCWRVANVRPATPTRLLPCVHEGQVIEHAVCGHPDRHVRECDKFDSPCTRGASRVRSCATCPDYSAGAGGYDPAFGVRHLLFHILPVGGNGVWRRGVEQLAARWPLFTGRKAVAVGTGPGFDPPAEVRRCLPADAEVVEVANSPDRREVATWGPLWDALRPSVGPNDAVLYGHAKGVTRQVDPGNSCQWWASLLYALALDHWPATAALLRRFPVVGSLKKVGRGFAGVPSLWHYSGTFFWLRGADALRRVAVVPPPPRWWGVEAWPGVAYTAEEAGCLFLEGRVGNLDLYNPRKWATEYRPAYSRWVQENPPQFPWVAEGVK